MRRSWGRRCDEALSPEALRLLPCVVPSSERSADLLRHLRGSHPKVPAKFRGPGPVLRPAGVPMTRAERRRSLKRMRARARNLLTSLLRLDVSEITAVYYANRARIDWARRVLTAPEHVPSKKAWRRMDAAPQRILNEGRP